MKRCAFALSVAVLCAGGCVYKIDLIPPDITAAQNDTPSASVFAIAQFEDLHPQKPYVGYAFQHCFMRHVLMIGPVWHKSEIPLERLLPETLGACMKELGYNTKQVDRVVSERDRRSVLPTGNTDYLITGTIDEFYFSTPSADFVPAEIRVKWRAVVTDKRGRVVLRQRMQVTDKKLFGFGTNGFFNIEPFVRNSIYKSMDQLLASAELKGMLWRNSGPEQ